MTDRHRTSSAAVLAAFLAAWDIPTGGAANSSARWCQAHTSAHTCGYAGEGKVEAVPMHVRAGLG
jgi:hypothetical protein